MPESTKSIYKTLSTLLALLFVGVLALLVWHSAKQREILADKNAQLSNVSRNVAVLEQEQDVLRSRLGQLKTEFETREGELISGLDAAQAANAGLQADIERLEAEHARTLTEEKEKASKAYAELEGQYDLAKDEIASLVENVESLERRIVDITETHQSEMAELKSSQQKRVDELEAAHKKETADLKQSHEAEMLEEQQAFEERLEQYRIALEGTDPERADQLAALQRELEEKRQAIKEGERAIEAVQQAKAELQNQLGETKQRLVEQEEALAGAEDELRGVRAELAQEQSALAALQRKHDVAVAKASELLAQMRQELQEAEQAHQETKAKSAAAMRAAKEAQIAAMIQAETEIFDLQDDLAAEKSAFAAFEEEHESTVMRLRGSLEAAEHALSEVESELDATKERAAQLEQAKELEIEVSQTTIAALEQDLARMQQDAAQELMACQIESEEALAYERGLYSDLSELGARQTEQGILLSLAEEDLRFRVSMADLPKSDLPSLDAVAELLNEHSELRARIEGHTDSGGPEEINLDLSQRRADAVKGALVERGVDEDRLAAVGIGEARPIADNSNFAGRSKNRRVEIYVIDDQRAQLMP